MEIIWLYNQAGSINPVWMSQAGFFVKIREVRTLRRPKKRHLYDQVYGPGRVWISDDPYAAALLAKLSDIRTVQPEINRLIELLYRLMIPVVTNACFPQRRSHLRTRMAPEMGKRGILHYDRPDPDTNIVIATLARAGVRPANQCFDDLTGMFPDKVRQDYFGMGRTTGEDHHVDGVDVGYTKVGGSLGGNYLLIPDPMGATGRTIVKTLDTYRREQGEDPIETIVMNLIITPEFLRRVMEVPNLKVFAFRIDRGMSSSKVQRSIPGKYPLEEKGLNDRDYIVPGAGGLGELQTHTTS